MNFFLSFFKGIAIGSGAILPGISSGVLCIIFGIYETLINCVLNFFKNIKYNFKILFPIILGMFVGIFLFGNILKYIFYVYPLQSKSIFSGLIIGSIPEIIKKSTSKSSFKLNNLIYLTISFLLGILLVYVENKHIFFNNTNQFSYMYIFFCGFMMAFGVIIPGVSSTLILMLLGIYDAYLLSVSSLYLPFLFPLVAGLLIGSFFCMKIIKFLLENFYSQTFYTIIGFTLGSIFVLLPTKISTLDTILSILCTILGTILSYTLIKKSNH